MCFYQDFLIGSNRMLVINITSSLQTIDVRVSKQTFGLCTCSRNMWLGHSTLYTSLLIYIYSLWKHIRALGAKTGRVSFHNWGLSDCIQLPDPLFRERVAISRSFSLVTSPSKQAHDHMLELHSRPCGLVPTCAPCRCTQVCWLCQSWVVTRPT